MPKKNRILLLQPPYGDYTYPFHSLSYVAPPLEGAGYQVDILDMNALWFRSVFTSESVQQWRDACLTEFFELDRRSSLTIEDQDRLVNLLQAVVLCDALKPEEAVETFKTEAFYDASAYMAARHQVRLFEKLLSILFGPYDFFHAFAVPPYEANGTQVAQKVSLSGRWIEDLAAILKQRVGDQSYLFCGITVPFSANLVPAMCLFKAVEKVFPNVIRVAGGTAIADIHKYKSCPEALQPFQSFCDYFYLGEAETAVVAFADWCQARTGAVPPQVVDLFHLGNVPSKGFPYIALTTHEGETTRFQPYAWKHRPPNYDWIDWDLYLAPEKRINYVPSRGCFWNQCTFCDYGLNDDGPTAPVRTMDAATVVSHLKPLVDQGVRHVYLAVDAIAPSFLKGFSGTLIQEQLPVQWACQLLLTRNFTSDMVQQLAESGLSLSSFGLESGSDRVLEWMGKGADRVEKILKPVFDAFRSSPIGLQPQFFFGFPGECEEDCQKTVDLLLEHRDIFSTLTKGGLFALCSGSMVAKEPEAFGIEQLSRKEGDDFGGILEYRFAGGEAPANCDRYKPYNDQIPYWNHFERPWLGGIDTFHSQMYVVRYGRDIFHQIQRTFAEKGQDWGRIEVTSSYDLHEILENVVIAKTLASGCHQSEIPDDAIERVLAPIDKTTARQQFDLGFCPYSEP